MDEQALDKHALDKQAPDEQALDEQAQDKQALNEQGFTGLLEQGVYRPPFSVGGGCAPSGHPFLSGGALRPSQYFTLFCLGGSIPPDPTFFCTGGAPPNRTPVFSWGGSNLPPGRLMNWLSVVSTVNT